MKRIVAIILLTIILISGNVKAEKSIDAKKEDMINFCMNLVGKATYADYNCSALVGAAIDAADIDSGGPVWTWTIDNAQGMKKIPISQIKRGDILNRSDKPNQHMMIYLGNNKVVESVPKEGVRVAKLRTSGYSAYRIVDLVNHSPSISITLDGKTLYGDVSPVIYNNRTLVPLRMISEGIGYDVQYGVIEGRKFVYVGKQGADVDFKGKDFVVNGVGVLAFEIGNNNLADLLSSGDSPYVNRYYYMDVAPKIIDSRTFIPIRALSEVMGLKVDWDERNRTVILNSPNEVANSDFSGDNSSSVDYSSGNNQIATSSSGYSTQNNNYNTGTGITGEIKVDGNSVTMNNIKTNGPVNTIMRSNGKGGMEVVIVDANGNTTVLDSDGGNSYFNNPDYSNDNTIPKDDNEYNIPKDKPKVSENVSGYISGTKIPLASGDVTYLSDSKIQNMDFTKEELDYILSDRLHPMEEEMFNLMNERRARAGLSPMILSMELTKVARTHVLDANKNNIYSDFVAKGGNPHSWSYSSNWRGGIYKGISEGAIMWDKPRELSNFQGDGYEIVHYYNNCAGLVNPEGAINGWENSTLGHNEVLMTKGNWKDLKYAGVGIGGSYACIWFGM